MSHVNSPSPLPPGFRFAGVACGIKPSGKPDLSLIVTDRPVVAAGVYTQNQIVAAPVLLCRDRTPSDIIRAVVTNSGNANACTGDQGIADAEAMALLVADQVGCSIREVLVMSTGVIGCRLPMDRVASGIEAAHAALGDDVAAFEAAAEAIRTTDVDRKTVVRSVTCGDKSYQIAAMAKGAGMIAPNMATMLGVVLTDAPLTPDSATEVLREVVGASFNRISVDGHTSTNDTLLLLSAGDNEPLVEEPLVEEPLRQFVDAASEACVELAKQIVADGEGAAHFFEIRVIGAATDGDADRIAATVAESLLVKTAITGGDPNWGRIVSAAGYAGVKLEPNQIGLKILGLPIYENGTPLQFDAAALSRDMKRSREVKLELRVGPGPGIATRWASDLTTAYVDFNAEYTT